MRWPALVVIVPIVACAMRAWAGDIFDLGVKTADRAVITVSDDVPNDWHPRSPMLDRLSGVIGVMDKKELLELRKTAMNVQAVDEPPGANREFVVHLFFGDKTKHVEILRDTTGTYLAREVGSGSQDKGRATRVKQEDFAVLSLKWSAYRGDWSEKSVPHKIGEVERLKQPLVPGWITIDRETLDKRFMGSTHQKIDGAVRDLAKTTLLVRLPKGYSPQTPAGVLVWVDAIQQELPTLYPSLFAAADELGLVVVAATRTGNDIPRGDRYQLALDGLATVARRCMVDSTRVYVSGESGGGKISTHLWACMPEIFQGAVPIVGLATYTSVPAGPGKVWPQDFIKPNAAAMKRVLAHRCAAVTGDQDFNHEPILQTAKVLVRDGLPVRVFDYAGLAHEVPNAEQFGEALRWVDEGPRAAHQEADTKAAELMTAYRDRWGDDAVNSDEQRAALVEVTRAGPWSLAAWEAARKLGATNQGP